MREIEFHESGLQNVIIKKLTIQNPETQRLILLLNNSRLFHVSSLLFPRDLINCNLAHDIKNQQGILKFEKENRKLNLIRYRALALFHHFLAPSNTVYSVGHF